VLCIPILWGPALQCTYFREWQVYVGIIFRLGCIRVQGQLRVTHQQIHWPPYTFLLFQRRQLITHSPILIIFYFFMFWRRILLTLHIAVDFEIVSIFRAYPVQWPLFSYLAGMSLYISLKIKKRHYEHHMIEAHK
jgi:hypothetical protein